MMRKFSCVQGCSDCCTYREYYPSVEYGKIGVLLLPEEIPAIEDLARKNDVNVKIIPRLGVGKDAPDKVIAYQMMGRNADGDLCPFLDTESTETSHGGLRCKIYEQRPLACRAYPVVDVEKEALLDHHCLFCKKFSSTGASSSSVQKEIEALGKIKAKVRVDGDRTQVWRYATATGKIEDRNSMLPEGWLKES